METKLVYLSDLKFNLKVWKAELRFHRKEMEKFEKKLEAVASRNPGVEAMAPLEGFQNKIIREREVIGRMLQRIRMKRRLLGSECFSSMVRMNFGARLPVFGVAALRGMNLATCRGLLEN